MVLLLLLACQGEMPIGRCGEYRVNSPNTTVGYYDEKMHEVCGWTGTTFIRYPEGYPIDAYLWVDTVEVVFDPDDSNTEIWGDFLMSSHVGVYEYRPLAEGDVVELEAGFGENCDLGGCWDVAPLTSGSFEVLKIGRVDRYGSQRMKIAWEVTWGDPEGDPEQPWYWGEGKDWTSYTGSF